MLKNLSLLKSGIGKAIKNNSDSNLVEQVRVLKQRPGFHYVSYTGDAGDYDSNCSDGSESDDDSQDEFAAHNEYGSDSSDSSDEEWTIQ
jgi:hypothetical protein